MGKVTFNVAETIPGGAANAMSHAALVDGVKLHVTEGGGSIKEKIEIRDLLGRGSVSLCCCTVVSYQSIGLILKDICILLGIKYLYL